MTVLNERLSISSSVGTDKAAEPEVLTNAIAKSVQKGSYFSRTYRFYISL